ncbi:peptidase M30, hyicolysin [Brachyspira sp.]|uniref:peptidase M30, hyicolysin n=1 Tax=Brachyspira sp. TaxID=1977261 RepID=UPI002615DA78|nr:peptidase M30, hyicolysin [Brachyspira sp.]
MKRTIFILLFFTIFINSCSVIGFDPRNNLSDYYYVMRINSFNKEKVDYVKFENIYESEKLIIYAESGVDVRNSSIHYIATEFNKHYNDMVSVYGKHTDVDNNGKIKILLLNINPPNSTIAVLGYFYPLDLLGKFNKGEILYMDIEHVNNDPYHMAGTIFHELQHLINFNVNFFEKGREMSIWLNEGLSESTSILFSPYTVNSRIEEFNKIDYYCFYTWELPIDVFSNYPSVSVFMNWLYKRSRNNKDVFRKIASSKEVNDYTKVLNSISSLGIGNSWDSLLLNWIEGIGNNEVNGAKLSLAKSGSNIPIYPGALIAYSGSLSSTGNLVTKSLSSGLQLALNKDMYIGQSPSAINVNIPNSSYSLRASKLYNASLNNNENYKPKYRNILFGNDGQIKKY